MGVLDEAIRQHLELKRKHGAEDGEIERQEREALGPARRDTPRAGEEAEADAKAAPVVDEADRTDEVAPAEDEEYAAEEAHEADDPPSAEEQFEPEPVPAEEPFPADDAAPPGDLHEGAETDPEDVLEETPDFLQETPEHDRLWFEQKPPRDFDFDE